MNLLTSGLREHPEANLPDSKPLWIEHSKKAHFVFSELERIRPLVIRLLESKEEQGRHDPFSGDTQSPEEESQHSEAKEVKEQRDIAADTSFIGNWWKTPPEDYKERVLEVQPQHHPDANSIPPVPLVNTYESQNRSEILPPKIRLDSKQKNLRSLVTLRSVYIDYDIIPEFARISRINTIRNIETCGFLCGKLKDNTLRLTHLVIPKQEGTYNTCTVTDDIGTWEALNKESILSLGWIHTHPTQSCFMSSVDLHTQLPFQLLLPEAIAIVYSPKSTTSYGIFRLTDKGIKEISACDNPEPFHSHDSGSKVYENLVPSRSHINIYSDPENSLKIIDLR